MKIFLSYASEQRDLAERLALALRNEGDQVFFDRDALHAGESFDDRIRTSISSCHLLIFLISQESLRAGAYTLTEIGLAQERWPHPAGHVMPVLIDETDIEAVPPYLGAVSILQPVGNSVAEVLNAVRKLRSRRRRVVGSRFAASTGVIVLASVVTWWRMAPDDPIAFQSIDVSALETGSDKADYRFDVSMRNAGAESYTIVGLSPRSESDEVRFSGIGIEWIYLDSGESRSASFSASLDRAAEVASFKWRLCYGYVTTESVYTELNAKSMNIDMFMAEHRREACSAQQLWTLSGAQ